jgi:polyketide biosynthesis acyl carrier protein
MTKEQVFDVVKAQILEVMGPDNVPPASIQPEVSLRDLGANSLDRMEVVSLSMQALSLRFPASELVKVSNIGELVEALYNKTKSGGPA